MAEADKPVVPVGQDGGGNQTLGEMIAVFPKRNQDLFNYLINTFVSMLPPEKATQFRTIAKEIERLLDEHTRAFITSLPPDLQAAALSTRDPRRSRFLLRLVAGRVSHLFASKNPKLPKSVIEELDQFLRKAFGQVVYDELNNEADEMFRGIPSGDDEEMWRQIKATPHWRRFADTILIRILFRFENFPNGKKTFMLIVGRVMQDMSKFQFAELALQPDLPGLVRRPAVRAQDRRAEAAAGLHVRRRHQRSLDDHPGRRASAQEQEGQCLRAGWRGIQQLVHRRPAEPFNHSPTDERRRTVTIRRINPGPRMTQAVVHGNTVYLAGQVAAEAKPSVAEQTKQVLAQIDHLLKEAGTDKTKLLSATIWLTDIRSFDEMNSVWDAWVSPGNAPARATVEAKLAGPKFLVEIAVIAALG